MAMDGVNTTSASHDACPKCGIPTSNDMEFCAECGHSLTTKCPSCAASMRWHMKHCPKCGMNIEKKKAELATEAERKREEEARLAQEREAERKRRQGEAEVRRQRRGIWWRRNGWKVVAGVLLVGSSTGYLAYRSSDSYAYRQAEKLFEASQLREAVSAFDALGDYMDSGDRAKEIRYQIADNMYESGDLSGAASAFVALESYRDSQNRSDAIHYEIAEGLYESGDLSGAASAFSALGAYRDSRSRAEVIHWFLLGFTKEGEVITDSNTGLQWRVGLDQDTNWNAANTWVNGLGGGWRMPTRDELRGLFDAGIGSYNWGPFENSAWWVWSGEVRDSSSAWHFNFDFGSGHWYDRSSSDFTRAFAVRPL